MSKKQDNLFSDIISWNNLKSAYQKTQKGYLKFKTPSLIFSQNLTTNLKIIQMDLIQHRFGFNDYHSFYVHDPKTRLIYAPSFKAKVVHHAINNILKDVYRQCFVFDSYACIEGKGVYAAVNRVHKFQRKAYWQYGSYARTIKLDIAKFFHTIDRDILKKLLRKKITCQNTLLLLDSLIDSSPNSLGLPLGNLTSQLFANIYLNQLDNYIKRTLQIKYYIRYADDMVLFVPDIESARTIIDKIDMYLNDTLCLKLHKDKSKHFPIYHCVNTLGFRFWLSHRLIRTDCKTRIKRKLNILSYLDKSDPKVRAKWLSTLNSWKGHIEYSNSYNLLKTILKRYSFLKIENNIFSFC